jgi:FkbM family methyltransferase
LRKGGFELTRYPHRESLGWHLRTLLKHLGITCVLDVGANVGQYGDFLRQLGYRGRIISFEPVRDTYLLLEKHATNDPNWTVVPLGLGSKNEQVTINVTRDSKLSSILLPDSEAVKWKFNTSLEVDHTEQITIARLDCIFDKYDAGANDQRVFLKTDTQGWALEVLSGAERCSVRGFRQSPVSGDPRMAGVGCCLCRQRLSLDRAVSPSA